MFRALLPVAISALPLAALSQTAPTCEGSRNACVRVLACIGTNGLYVDGAVFGRGQGSLAVLRSDGVSCTGAWNSDGPFGGGIANMTCEDGLTGQVVYFLQDNDTGTAIGRGEDSQGRPIEAWSGLNILEFLSPDGRPEAARLPCAPETQLLS